MRKHENPHTPSSQKHGTTKTETKGERVSNEKGGGIQGKLGDKNSGRGRNGAHKGETREKPEPDPTEVVLEERCANCGRKLGDPDRVETKIIEDIPDSGSL